MSTNKNPKHVATKPAPLSEVLGDGAGEIKETLGHMAHDSKDAVGRMVQDGKTRVDGMVDQGQERVSDWKNKLGKAVEERPFRSLLIASGAGALLGMILRRRNS